MQVTIHVPASLRQYTASAWRSRSSSRWPICCGVCTPIIRGIVERTLDEQGRVREHGNVFVDGESMRAGSSLGLETAVGAGAEVCILPAVSGGGY
jgi:hypothetical protein